MGKMVEIAKQNFFDRAKVERAVDKVQLRMLKSVGALTRKVAQRSMKKSKKPSAPGSPPRTKKGQLKKLLYYYLDPSGKSVIVGPIGFHASGQSLPETHEEGGSLVYRRGKQRRAVESRYPARPYMRPAFDYARPRILDGVKDAIS